MSKNNQTTFYFTCLNANFNINDKGFIKWVSGDFLDGDFFGQFCNGTFYNGNKYLI